MMKFKRFRSVYVFILDIIIVSFGYLISLFVFLNFSATAFVTQSSFFGDLIYIIIIYGFGFLFFKLNKSLWSKISLEEGIRVVLVNAFLAIIVALLSSLKILSSLSYSVIFISFLLITLTQEILRFSYRSFRLVTLGRVTHNNTHKNILIYGAGNAGSIVAKEYLQGDSLKGNIVGFVDDKPGIQGKTIYGVKVLSTGDRLSEIVKHYKVDEIIVAAPSQSLKTQRDIMEKCYTTGLPVKSVNSVENLINGEPLKNNIKQVDIVDLLDRKEIKLDNIKVSNDIVRKNILITGAAGSIGSELVRQIIKFNPKTLILIDIHENGLYNIQQEILMLRRDKAISDTTELIAYVSSIRDYNSLERIFSLHKIDMLFHAAAHKHVPLMESSPIEAIKNNIFGTHNLIELSKKYNVKKFLNVSTDKAVNPTNVMGATKRFNEMILQSQDDKCETKFMAVRFGNVLGSNGSVVPLFQKQIISGGPVTVTHPEIVRYFMTIPEAVSLILDAVTFAKGGEIFVLDMGEPVKILDLAERVITLSGYRPYKDIDIQFSGLRPGEKLFEELLMSEEGLEKTENNLIFITKPIKINKKIIDANLSVLRELIDNPSQDFDVISIIEQIVPTFKHEPNGIAVVRK